MKVVGIKERSPQLPYWLAQIGGKKRRERHGFETISSQLSNTKALLFHGEILLFHHGFKFSVFIFFLGLLSRVTKFSSLFSTGMYKKSLPRFLESSDIFLVSEEEIQLYTYKNG